MRADLLGRVPSYLGDRLLHEDSGEASHASSVAAACLIDCVVAAHLRRSEARKVAGPGGQACEGEVSVRFEAAPESARGEGEGSSAQRAKRRAQGDESCAVSALTLW